MPQIRNPNPRKPKAARIPNKFSATLEEEPILAHYDRLADPGKQGVAWLRNQTCCGCHMRVPLGVVRDVKHGHDVCLCDNCRRCLYLREEEPAAGHKAPVLQAS